MFVFIILICMDIGWHIWECRERKRLDRCWEDLFNSKLESDQRWISLFSKISQKKENQ
jgi:hypothetical protein